MKKIMLLALSLVFALTISACGGSGGGGASVTCAPATLTPNAGVANGSWRLDVSNINSDCPTPPSAISCQVTMSQASDGNVTITPAGNCTVTLPGYGTSSNYTSITSAAGAVDGNTFYWVAVLTTSIPDISYSETDTVTCDTVTNFADGVQAQVSSTSTYSGQAGSGSCSSTSTVTFTQL